MEDSRPRNLTLGVNFGIESDFECEHVQNLHVDLEHQEQRSYIRFKLSSFLVIPINPFVWGPRWTRWKPTIPARCEVLAATQMY